MLIKYRPDIDGLRAISVLPVLLFHFGISAVPGGFAGVDVFFVISGYVITSTLYRQMMDETFSVLSFYERRVRRIFPAMLLVVAATLISGYFLLWPPEYVRLAQSAAASIIGFANIFFYLDIGYFDQSSDLLPLLHMWSLAVEEQFYFVWPPMMLAALWIGRKSQASLAAMTIGLIVISFSAAVYGVGTNPSGAFYLPQMRAWELAVGALLVFIPTSADRRWPAQLAAALGIALVAYGFVGLTKTSTFPGLNALFPTLGAALVIWSGSSGTMLSTALSTRPVVFIGKISYSLYLWHWPLVVFYRHINEGAALTAMDAAWLTAASVALAYLSWRFVETPLRREKGPLAGARRTFGWAAAALSTVFAMTAVIHYADGFGARLESRIQKVLSYASYDPKAQFRIGQCFLDVGNELADFDLSTCLPQGEKTAVLWGDSTIAHYYQGMREPFQSEGYVLGQFTASLCPPIPGRIIDPRPKCAPFNDLAFAEIQKARPDVLVLGALWPLDPQSLDSLGNVLRIMTAAGTRVVLLGPVPTFASDIPGLLAERLRAKATGSALDQIREDPGPEWIDDTLKGWVAGIPGVHYISLMKLLCPNAMCTIMTAAGEPMYIDKYHVNDIGSKALGPDLVRAILN